MSVSTSTTNGPPRLCPVSEIVSCPVAWLWPQRLALGKLALFDGDPGLGKSFVALDLCARLSTGRPFPDGTPAPGVCQAIVLSTEDGADDTIRPRLEALGADLSRVFVLHQGRDELGEPLYFPSQLQMLDEELARTDARLVVIDPIIAFLDPSVFASSDQSVRRALLPLARLAARHACAILLIRHLNKRGAGRSLYRGSGSIAFLAVCRSGWLFASDPVHAERTVLAQVKNNLAPAQPSLAYVMTHPENASPSLAWLGPTTWNAEQLLASSPATASRLDRASEFLAAFLANGPRTSREVWAAAQEQGLSERTIERAKHDLGVRSAQVGNRDTRVSYWLLKDQEPPGATAAPDPESDLEPWLKPLREKYPPATPLDDL